MKIEIDVEPNEVESLVKALDTRRAYFDTQYERAEEPGHWTEAQTCHDLADRVAKAAGMEVAGNAGYVYGLPDAT